jgi:hypothetical protein
MSWLLASAVVAVVLGWPGVDPVAFRSGARAPQSVNSPIDLVQTQLTAPSKVTVGKLFRIALADGGRQLEERYRENNTRAVRLTVLRAEDPKKK